MRGRLIALTALAVCQLASAADFDISARGRISAANSTLPLPASPVYRLKAIAQLGNGPDIENSGIVKSRHHEDLYWIQNDSGDEPRIYAVNSHGEVYGAERYATTPGVLIAGATNVDWEDIAVDASGNVLIADFGNNSNDRRDLVIYVVPEPRSTAGRTTWLNRWFFRYPDQQSFPAPAEDFNFDAEALFTVGNQIFVLSKNRSDPFTKLYQLVDPE